jgi:hypothetical protein
MREVRPPTIMRKCEYCEQDFEAKKKGISYVSFCPTCTKKRVWTKFMSTKS